MSPLTTPSPDSPADLVELGRIVSAYGVRGWVKVQPHSSDSQVLLAAKTWWLKAPVLKEGPGVLSSAFAVQVAASRPQGATVVAQLEGIADRDQAHALKGHTVWVPRTDFPAAQEDEYYWVDLIGCQFFGLREGRSELIGQVADVLDNGAHAVLRVARATTDADGNLVFLQTSRGKPQEVLVPFVQAHVHTVDIGAKRLESNWPADF